MTERRFSFSFFSEDKKRGLYADIKHWTLAEIAEGFREVAQHRPSTVMDKLALNKLKAGPCFIAGLAETRNDVESRSCITLDGDNTADSLALDKATEGYCRIVWNTFKDGLREPPKGSDLPYMPDPLCTRIRVILPLDRDMTKEEWVKGAGVLAQFPFTDDKNIAFGALSYNPASWSGKPAILFEPGKLFPADLVVSTEALSNATKIANYNDPATEVATTEHLASLREKLRSRAKRTENPTQKERYLEDCRSIYSIMQGKGIGTRGNRNEICFKFCNLLARELNECTVESILDICKASMLDMQSDGSDETLERWAKTINDHKGMLAAEAALLDFDLPMPTEGKNSLGEDAQETDPTHDPSSPLNVLNASFGILPVPGSSDQIFWIEENGVCRLEKSPNPLTRLVATKAVLYKGDELEKREWTAKLAKEQVDHWRNVGRVMDHAPVAARFKSDPGYCFKRLSFDPTQGPTPAWDEFCSRLSNQELFKAFVWTAFELKNKGRQILWLTGHGQDGKSKVLGAIVEALGDASFPIKPEMFKSTFGTSPLDGKRFIHMGDCKDPSILTNETVRNVTSGDSVKIEFKGKDSYDKNLHLKLMIMSNIYPNITSSRADESRLLPLTIAESPIKDDRDWPDRLSSELPAFLWDCRETYTRICPKHGDFKLDPQTQELVKRCSGLFEDDFANTVKTYLVITGNKSHMVHRAKFNENRRNPMLDRWTNEQCERFWSYCATQHRVDITKQGGVYYMTGCLDANSSEAKNYKPLAIVPALDNAPATGEGAQ